MGAALKRQKKINKNKIITIPIQRAVERVELKISTGVPIVAQWLTNPTRNHEVSGSIPALAQWVKDLALP